MDICQIIHAHIHTYAHKYIYRSRAKQSRVNFQQLANHKVEYAVRESLIIPGNAAENKYCRNANTHTHTQTDA